MIPFPCHEPVGYGNITARCNDPVMDPRAIKQVLAGWQSTSPLDACGLGAGVGVACAASVMQRRARASRHLVACLRLAHRQLRGCTRACAAVCTGALRWVF
jgi:hypothetical protein